MLLLRLSTWTPVLEGEPLRPIAITARLFSASTATPQLLQFPPEKPAAKVLPLDSVVPIVVPDNR